MKDLSLVAGCGVALLLAGCAAHPWDLAPGASPSPDAPWTPPPAALERQVPPAPPLATPDRPRSLAEMIDLGLAQNPETRAAWLAARAAAAGVGAARGAYYPQVNLSVSAERVRIPAAGGLQVLQETSYGPVLDATWLLLDFGGRHAMVEEARQALVAADWTHNAALADRVLAVTRAFHAHQAAIALAEAQRVLVRQAQASVDAAEARRQAGVATISDVLQARTALSRQQLTLEEDDGNIATTRAELNNAVGLPAATPTAIEPLPESMPVEETKAAIDALVAEAVASRPEVGTAEARVREAEAHATAIRSAGLPSLVATGSVGESYFTNPSNHVGTYSAGVAIRVPVFTGFTQTYNELQAQQQLEQTRADAESVRQLVELDVVKSYQDVLTAVQRVRTAADLVTSATRNEEVARGRYQAGAGNILELLTAQGFLADARAQDVQARADWLAAVATLARARGTVTVPRKGTNR